MTTQKESTQQEYALDSPGTAEKHQPQLKEILVCNKSYCFIYPIHFFPMLISQLIKNFILINSSLSTNKISCPELGANNSHNEIAKISFPIWSQIS